MYSCRPSSGTLSQVSAIDVTIGYKLDGPGIESRYGRDFLHPSRPALGPTQSPVGYRVFAGCKATGACRWPPTPSSTEVQGRIELYLSSPSEPSCSVLGRNSPFTQDHILWLLNDAKSDSLHLCRLAEGKYGKCSAKPVRRDYSSRPP